MDLKTRLEILPCGKCEDMMDCDLCIFQKEAKELYKQIRADAIEEVGKAISDYLFDSPMMNPIMTRNEILLFLKQLKGAENE